MWPPDPNYPGADAGQFGNTVYDTTTFAAFANRTTSEWTDLMQEAMGIKYATSDVWFGERWRRTFSASP